MKKISDIEVIAHRGGANPHVENTLESFLYGLQLGFKAIEMDLRYAYFGRKFFLEHDFLHHPRYRKNHIEKIIEGLPEDIALYIELKTNSCLTNIFARQFNKIYNDRLKERNTCIISFNPFILLKLKKMNAQMRMGFICGNRFFKALFENVICHMLKPDSYVINRKFMNRRTVKFAKKHGMKLYAYVINRNEDRHKALELNLDGIITDYPI